MLGMQLSLYCYQECLLCEQSTANHASNCLYVQLELLLDRKLDILCPKCNTGSVDLNQQDYFECRKCRTQFSRSMLDEGKALERSNLIDFKSNEHFPVFVLPKKGKREIRIDKLIKQMEAKIKQARRNKKKVKK